MRRRWGSSRRCPGWQLAYLAAVYLDEGSRKGPIIMTDGTMAYRMRRRCCRNARKLPINGGRYSRVFSDLKRLATDATNCALVMPISTFRNSRPQSRGTSDPPFE